LQADPRAALGSGVVARPKALEPRVPTRFT